MEKIGFIKARFLRNLPPEALTEEDRKALQRFDGEDTDALTEEIKQYRKDYAQRVFATDMVKNYDFNKDKLWQMFNCEYEILTGRKFELTKDSLANITPVMRYFLRSDDFFDSPNLDQNFSKPSFDKGLLIIGGFGTGKSSVMQALKNVLTKFKQGFAFRNMNNVVTEFESSQSEEDKRNFWFYVSKGNCLFDDVKTEREASNYGKANLFKEILEKRTLEDCKTHITCNYSESNPYDLEAGLDEFGEKYGGRVYDRLAEKFNVIEFKGKSMRR